MVCFSSKLCNVTGLANGRELARSETGRDSIVSHVTEVAEQRQNLYSQVEELKDKLMAVRDVFRKLTLSNVSCLLLSARLTPET